MARNLLLLKQQLSGNSQIGFAIGSLFLCAFALFMCATHSRKWRKWSKWRACYGCAADHQDPVIQLNPERIQASYDFGEFDPSARSGEATLWKKNIMMGGKCQLPDFSGVIIYDTEGNIVPPTKTARALAWN